MDTKLLFDIIPILIIFLIFWVILIYPVLAKEKREKKIISNAKVGDIIVTKGGIQGKIHTIKEDSVLIQSDKSSLEIKKNKIESIE